MADSKANFYRNKVSDEINPALTYPKGYEDEHPEQFEPVSDAKGNAAMKAAGKKGKTESADSKADEVDAAAEAKKVADAAAAAEAQKAAGAPVKPAIPPAPTK